MPKEIEIMDKTKPLVSVCIATYNRQEMLPAVLDVVLSQTYRELEVIVVDDKSEDRTQEIVEEYCGRDERIRCIRHYENKGLAAARNTAVFNAKGKYFTFIDDDDKWFSEFIEEFVKIAEQYDDKWSFCCGQSFMGRDGDVVSLIPCMEGKLVDYIKKGHTPPTSAQFYFTEALKSVGGYDERVRSGVDHDLWLKLAFDGCYIKSVEKCLAPFNSNIGYNRMTSDMVVRRKEVNKSLKLWKDQITEHIGEDFYEHFAKSYEGYLDTTYFMSLLKQRELKGAVQLFRKSNFKSKLIGKAFNFFRKKILKHRNKNNCITTICEPAFPPYLKGKSVLH